MRRAMLYCGAARWVKMMDFAWETRNCVFKTRNFASNTRNFALKTRNCVFKMMNFAFKTMDFAGWACRAVWGAWGVGLNCTEASGQFLCKSEDFSIGNEDSSVILQQKMKIRLWKMMISAQVFALEVSFLFKNPDFSFRNPDFLSGILIFYWKIAEFIIKHSTRNLRRAHPSMNGALRSWSR